MDPEMRGVLDRIYELTNDLSEEYQRGLDQDLVTERARNLFHEVLIKIRSALDMMMFRAWTKHCRSAIGTPRRAELERSVHFPICEDRTGFDRRLSKLQLHLNSDNPDLYALLLQAQPFSTGQKHFLHLRDMANLGKHVRLAPQTRRSRPAKRLTAPDGSFTIFTSGTEFHCDSYMGYPVDPESRLPRAPLEDVNWVSFQIEGCDVGDPVIFCQMHICALATYIPKLLAAL